MPREVGGVRKEGVVALQEVGNYSLPGRPGIESCRYLTSFICFKLIFLLCCTSANHFTILLTKSCWKEFQGSEHLYSSSYFSASCQCYQGHRSPPAEVVWCGQHRNRGWRRVLPPVAPSFVERGPNALSGSDHTEVRLFFITERVVNQKTWFKDDFHVFWKNTAGVTLGRNKKRKLFLFI